VTVAKLSDHGDTEVRFGSSFLLAVWADRGKAGADERLRAWPDSFRFYDRPSPIFVGAGSDPIFSRNATVLKGLAVRLEVIEQGYVGMPFDGVRARCLGQPESHGRAGCRLFGVVSRLAFERQADSDFAQVPIAFR
jgi:hypothetical protein